MISTYRKVDNKFFNKTLTFLLFIPLLLWQKSDFIIMYIVCWVLVYVFSSYYGLYIVFFRGLVCATSLLPSRFRKKHLIQFISFSLLDNNTNKNSFSKEALRHWSKYRHNCYTVPIFNSKIFLIFLLLTIFMNFIDIFNCVPLTSFTLSNHLR